MNSIDEKYIQRISELIYDDNTIVTCTSLSKILKIKVSEAQILLDKYVENTEVLTKDFSCTYVIIGINTDDIISVSITKDDELQKKKNMLRTIVSQHVYSVQNTKDLDLIALANVEPFTERNMKNVPLLGTVVSSKATKRKLKKTSKKSNSTTDLKEEKRPVEIKEEKRSVVTKDDKVTENKNKFKKTSIGNFFTPGNAQNGNNFKTKIEGKTKQKNMMANFFSKPSSKTGKTNGHTDKESLDSDVKRDDNANSESEKELKDSSQEDAMDSQKELENGTEEEAMEVDDNEPVAKPEQEDKNSSSKSRNKKDTSKSSKKSKKRKTGGKSDQPSKRKRIIEARDSDSDMFASSESDTEVVPDLNYFEENYEEDKQTAPSLPSKTRKMKQVTEEYMDEDGYMNTVAKYVMISDEEEENDKEQKPQNAMPEMVIDEKPAMKKKEVSPPMAKKDNSPKKTKNGKGKAAKVPQNQPSIMNFFKKN